MTGSTHLPSWAAWRAVASTLAPSASSSRGGITSRPRGFCGSWREITKVSARNRWTARVCSSWVVSPPSNSEEISWSATSAVCPLPICRVAEGVYFSVSDSGMLPPLTSTRLLPVRWATAAIRWSR